MFLTNCIPRLAQYSTRFAAFGIMPIVLACFLQFINPPRADAVLVAHFDIEETAGTTTTDQISLTSDTTSGAFNTTLLAPVPTGTSSSLDFSGAGQNDPFTGFQGIAGTGARTIAAWVKLEATGGQANMIATWGLSSGGAPTLGQRNSFSIDSTGRLRFEIGGGFAVGTSTDVSDGQWHHVAMRSADLNTSTANVGFFVDGVLDAVSTMGTANPINSTAGFFSIGNHPTGNGQIAQPFKGVLDEIRIYDNSLSDLEISDLSAPVVGAFGATIDRVTGNITLSNTTGSTINFVSYQIASVNGAIADGNWLSVTDNYDANSGGSLDSTDNWLEFPTSSTLVAEAEQPGGNGITLGTNDSIDFGNLWQKSPFEGPDSIAITLYHDDNSTTTVPLNYTGNGANSYEVGDLNFDGSLTAADWNLFRSNFLSDLEGLSIQEGYLLGDFNADGFTDGRDFRIFKTAFNENNPGGFEAMLASIPEPSSMLLSLFAILATAVTRVRGRFFKLQTRVSNCHETARTRASSSLKEYLYMPSPKLLSWKHLAKAPVSLTTFLALSVLALSISACSADTIEWTGNGATDDFFDEANWFNTTAMAALVPGTIDPNTDINNDLVIAFGNPFVNAASFANAIQLGRGATGGSLTMSGTSYLDTVGASGANGIRIDPVTGTNQPFALSGSARAELQFMLDLDVTLSGTASLDLAGGGNAVNSSTIDFLSLGTSVNFLNESTENVIAEHLGKFTVGGLPAAIGTNVSLISDGGTGAILTPTLLLGTLSLSVNTLTGEVLLINNSSVATDFDFYEIFSASDSLTPAGWNSLQDLDSAAFPAGDNSGNGWEEGGGAHAGDIGEAYLLGSSVLAAGSSVNLGQIYDVNGGTEDLLLEYTLTGIVPVIQGSVDYVSTLSADFDVSSTVDGTDLAIWETGFGTASGAAKSDGDANLDGDVDGGDFLSWQRQLGLSSASSASLATIPEPSSIALILAGIAAVLCGRSSRRFSTIALLLVISFMTLDSTTYAARTADRLYQLGDDASESATAGAAVGDPSFGLTFDSAGTVGNGNLHDLTPAGNPLYVSTTGRPVLAGAGLGITFDGAGDYLSGDRLGLPSTSVASLEGGGPEDYAGISNRGIQFWVKPNSSGSGNSTAQAIVTDTNQHGVRISETDTWVMRYGGLFFDTNLSVNFDQWSHVMLVRSASVGQSNAVGSQLFVNGELVSVRLGGYGGGADNPLVLGANTNEGTGEDLVPLGTKDFFTGVIDDLEMFVLGTSTSDPSIAYGDFDYATDNEFAADALAGFVDGDITGDGLVAGDGSGSVLTDDVAAFVANWQFLNTVDNVVAGDLVSRSKGDFNLDGIVDLADWGVLRLAHSNASLLNLGALLAATQVPEPSTCLLALLAVFGLPRTASRRIARNL